MKNIKFERRSAKNKTYTREINERYTQNVRISYTIYIVVELW